MNYKKDKKIMKKSFHPIRPIRMNEQTWERFKKNKQGNGTWNNFINKILDNYEKKNI